MKVTKGGGQKRRMKKPEERRNRTEKEDILGRGYLGGYLPLPPRESQGREKNQDNIGQECWFESRRE